MKYQLVLDYHLGEGALGPYLEGLSEGIALARQCRRCDRVTFPPERNCTCQSQDNLPASIGWKTLAGTATIVHRTVGLGGGYALARFDGADNLAVCRIDNPDDEGSHATLLATGEYRPGITIEISGEPFETID